MKTVSFTDFRKKASKFISEVEHGETIILLRRGRPIAEVIPFSDKNRSSSAANLPSQKTC